METKVERRRVLDRFREKARVVVEVLKIGLILAAVHFCFVAANVVVRLYNETKVQGAALELIRADVSKIANGSHK